MSSRQTSVYTRIKHAFKVLLGKAHIAEPDALVLNMKWLNFNENGDIIIECSDYAEDMLGFSEISFVGKSYSTLIFPKDLKLRNTYYRNVYQQAQASNQSNFITKALCYRVQYKDGNYHWVTESGVFTTNQKGEKIYIAFLVEIEDKNIEIIKQNYKKYEDNIEEYINFCDSIQSPIVMLNTQQFLVGNKIAHEVYEVETDEELQNISLNNIMDISEEALTNLISRSISGNIRNLYFDFLQGDGTQIDIVGYVYPLKHLDCIILVYQIASIQPVGLSQANRLLYSRLFEDNPIPMAIINYEKEFVHTANASARKLYGYNDDFQGNIPIREIVPCGFEDGFTTPLEEIVKQGYMNINEQKHVDRQGKPFYVDIFAFPYQVQGKQMACYSITDVNERVESKQKIYKLGIALEHSPNFIIIADENLVTEYVNATFLNRCGLQKAEVINKSISQFFVDNIDSIKEMFANTINNGDVISVDMLCKGEDNDFWVHLLTAPVKSETGQIVGVVFVGEDLTLRQAYDYEIHKLKLFDNMTGLGNRQYIFKKLTEYYKTSASQKEDAVLAIIDIDKLSGINESLGLSSGDIIIKTTANRLKTQINKNDVLARLGNDEFVLLHTLTDSNEDIEISTTNLINNILQSFQEAVVIDNHSLIYDVSIGLVFLSIDKEASNPESALRCAEMALYQAKQIQGMSSYYQFTSELVDVAHKRFNLEKRLKKALAEKQFVLYYQSKINLQTKKVYSYEALLRWIDDDKIIPPLDFIPFAEKTGLILPISDWVLEEACRQSVKWEKENKQAKIAINLSPRQFQEADFVKKVKSILLKTGVNPANIELEITESMLIQDMNHTLSLLHQLKALGVTLAIDDFGTGYSSFAYIKEMPIDVLKVDKVFIDNLPHNKKDCAIATTIITLAKELNMLVVAEGIENEQQAQFLQKNHCDYGQGYFYAKPVHSDLI